MKTLGKIEARVLIGTFTVYQKKELDIEKEAVEQILTTMEYSLRCGCNSFICSLALNWGAFAYLHAVIPSGKPATKKMRG